LLLMKPPNILVALHDGVPVPKVTDFGIARATEERLTDAMVYTRLHPVAPCNLGNLADRASFFWLAGRISGKSHDYYESQIEALAVAHRWFARVCRTPGMGCQRGR